MKQERLECHGPEEPSRRFVSGHHADQESDSLELVGGDERMCSAYVSAPGACVKGRPLRAVDAKRGGRGAPKAYAGLGLL
jgi:hypothetical protein